MDKFKDSLEAFHNLLSSMTREQLLAHHEKYLDDASTTLFEFFSDEDSSFTRFDMSVKLLKVIDLKTFEFMADPSFAANDDIIPEAA